MLGTGLKGVPFCRDGTGTSTPEVPPFSTAKPNISHSAQGQPGVRQRLVFQFGIGQ